MALALRPSEHAYVGRAATRLPPGMYAVTVVGPREARESFRVMLGGNSPAWWRRQGEGWQSDMTRVGLNASLVLWENLSHPISRLELRCEPNLAAAKIYRMSPEPNYRCQQPGYCYDINNRIYLTDGVLPGSKFEGGRVVRWENAEQVTITLDLERTYRLSRVYVDAGGGGDRGLFFPTSITVEGAPDASHRPSLPQLANKPGALDALPFFLLGQRVGLQLPEKGEYCTHDFEVPVSGQARFIRVTVGRTRGQYIFLDEIEAY